MTVCTKTLDAVRKRLEDRKSLEEIGKELCDAVDDPRGKAIRLVKFLEVKDKKKYLTKENSSWLGYNINYIRDSEEYIDKGNEIIPEEIKQVERMKKLKESIKDEMCKCGHLLSQHMNTFFEKGHGRCSFNKVTVDDEGEIIVNKKSTCTCERFKWDSFIFKDTEQNDD